MPPSPTYVIGVDLGTTNSALAYSKAAGLDPRELPPVEQFDIAQVTSPGEVRAQALLPSALYIYGDTDFPSSAVALPWDDTPQYVIGQLAKTRGAEVPQRIVNSAKSWLSHSAVDRTSAILPTAAPDGVQKISPVEASRRYLEHLKQAWEHAHPEAPFKDQQLLVTVPASFDAVARELTEKATAEAGYKNVILLEEPQAAFYAWIERHPDWRERVKVGDLILVVDVGGGTTDFTLIAVTESGGELQLERLAVGEHILLGGDNMDLALARFMEQELAAKGRKLDALQLNALWQNCRAAKEKMFAPGETAEEYPVTVLGRGSSLIGGSIKASLKRTDVEQIVLEGFFPEVTSQDLPVRARRAALYEIGLPYATDTAVTRHLAKFLRQHAASSEHGALRRGPSGLAAPTHVLFNGGVFHAAPLRTRLLDTLNKWLAAEGLSPAIALEGEDLMQAVSRGATYYGLARMGHGVRIRGGIPRSYYIGIQPSMPAVPGMRPPLKALTVAPFGMEEGTGAKIPGREFGLLIGEPADFRFFASVQRKDDKPGEMLEEVTDDMEELAPIEVMLPGDSDSGVVVPVSLETEITETGQLQLWCVARDGRRWKLEYNVRETVEQ
ncbi:MAG: Hsp70 family protein [Bryobacterales bacterium]|nr:Hsp70 family protein [Bryobacterales bacterium]